MCKEVKIIYNQRTQTLENRGGIVKPIWLHIVTYYLYKTNPEIKPSKWKILYTNTYPMLLVNSMLHNIKHSDILVLLSEWCYQKIPTRTHLYLVYGSFHYWRYFAAGNHKECRFVVERIWISFVSLYVPFFVYYSSIYFLYYSSYSIFVIFLTFSVGIIYGWWFILGFTVTS